MKTVEDANIEVKNKINKVGGKYKPTYHASSPVGWANDPNGAIWYKNKAHLYFQYNPYDVVWGPMHWGHFVSTDLVSWEFVNVVLAPDSPHDLEFGCFSGTAIEDNDELVVFYTGVANQKQQQMIARSKDGYSFTKTIKPVITSEMVPSSSSISDFRDPKIFKSKDTYYCLCGTKTNNKGDILLYKSNDLSNFSYVGSLLHNNINNFECDGVCECPDYVEIDSNEVLIFSPQFLKNDGSKYENIHSVVYMLGHLDKETGIYYYDNMREIDSGFDFYAAQTFRHKDGRTIMTAWLQMWDRTMPTSKDGWVGCYILPRSLTVKNNHLYQTPVEEIKTYRKNKIEYNNQKLYGSLILGGLGGKTIELEIKINTLKSKRVGVKLLEGENNYVDLYYDKEIKKVVMDRSRCEIQIDGKEENKNTRSADVEYESQIVDLRIFIDNSTIEVFINDGYSTISANVYNEEHDGISFYSDNEAEILNVVQYQIER